MSKPVETGAVSMGNGVNIENLSCANLILEINRVLNATHAESYDPLRFAYIQSVFQRLSEPHHATNTVLNQKVQNSVEQYVIDFIEQRDVANAFVEDISNNFPDYLEEAQILFEQCEFRQLLQLSTRLTNSASLNLGLRALRALNEELDNDLGAERAKQKDGSVDNKQPHTLEDILSQHQKPVSSFAGGIQPAEADVSRALPPQLRSMKAHRESVKRFNIDQIIARAIDDSPENPGPHNPQMLAIEALTQMRDLSPKYLRRFASYIETLLWLENPGSKLATKKKRS